VKLYERGDDQILVMATTNEDGEPIIKVTTNVEVMGEISCNIGYTPKSASDEDVDAAFAKMEKAFSNFTEDMAVGGLKGILRGMGLKLPGFGI